MREGTIVTDRNIYEFTVEKSVMAADRYIVTYLKSGQPTMNVIKGTFTKSQIEDVSTITKRILEQEGDSK